VSSPKSRSPLFAIALVVAVDVLGLTIIIPFLPFYAQSFGATPFVVGALISTYALFQLVSGPILGSLSDRFGRRPVLLFSQIGTFLGFLMLAHSQALWMVFLSRIIDGSTAGNISVAQAYIADVTKPEDRAKAFAIVGIAFGFGFLVGPAISGVLADYGPVYPVYAAAALSLTSILMTFFVLKEPPVHAESKSERKLSIFQWGEYARQFRNPAVGTFLLQFLAFHFSFSLFFSGFPLFAERRFLNDGVPYGPREVGYLYAYSGFLGMMIQGGLIARAVRKFGEIKVVIFAFAASALGYAILGASFHLPVLLLASTVSAFGHGALRPALTALVSRQAGARNQGMILGLTQSLNSISQIVAPLIAGYLIGHGWLSVWALTSSVISIWGLSLILRARTAVQPVSA